MNMLEPYHVCRPMCIEKYYENGIRAYTKEEVKEEIRLRLLNQDIMMGLSGLDDGLMEFLQF